MKFITFLAGLLAAVAQVQAAAVIAHFMVLLITTLPRLRLMIMIALTIPCSS